MGGIADYSGSLVLQLPLAEACHVAVQAHPLPAQRVWRHMEVRHVGMPSFCVTCPELSAGSYIVQPAIPSPYTWSDMKFVQSSRIGAPPASSAHLAPHGSLPLE